jgi:hypothetical protein
MTTMTTKELVLQAIDTLPDDADGGEVIHQILFLRTPQRRLERIDDEPTYTQEEVEQQMAEWHG